MTPLILLVEDEEHLAEGLLFNLEAEGYRTRHFADGAEALAWLLATPEDPAIILLDVMLPGADGFTIVRTIRTFWKDCTPVPTTTFPSPLTSKFCSPASRPYFAALTGPGRPPPPQLYRRPNPRTTATPLPTVRSTSTLSN